jgi:hypothetical protein
MLYSIVPLRQGWEKLLRMVREKSNSKQTTSRAAHLIVICCSMWIFCLSANITGQLKPVPMLKMDTTAQRFAYGVKGLETVQMGGRSRESIAEVVKLKLPTLKKIYNQRLTAKPGLEGQIKTKFRIDEYGKVVFSEIVESSIKDSVLENELLNEINSWIFHKIDKPGDITEVIYPFNFKNDYSLAVLATIISLLSLFISLLVISQNSK